LIPIILDDNEMAFCMTEALRRKQDGDARNLNHSSTYSRTDEERIKQETGGCCAEFAVRKHLGEDLMLPFNTFHHVPDILPDIEVRHTYRDNGMLIVRTNDPESRRYVLVTGAPPELVIRGWFWGHEARQPKYLRNPRGYRWAYWVSQVELHPLELAENITWKEA